MTAMQWARLRKDVQSPLRRGAWYRILKLGAQQATLDIRGRPTPIERGLLEITLTPRVTWTVVPRPGNAPRYPRSWGSRYAVCPNCRDRAQLEGQPASLRCSRCNGLFDVAWNDPYLATG